MIIYVLIEALAWYTTVWEYPKAHDQYYYANRYNKQIGDERIEDSDIVPRGEPGFLPTLLKKLAIKF